MTQNELILKHLKKGKTLTAMQALNLFGCFRLAARVADLKASGLNIVSEFVKCDGKTFAKYSLK